MTRDEEIFAAVCELAAAERARFLDRTCDGDAALRARIDELLGGIAEAQRVMPTPLVARGLGAAEEKAGDRIGRFKLIERLGEGGCGVVWLAEQEEPVRRRVALKVIKLGMDTKEVIARFEAERQALAVMEHPGIARVFEGGATENGRPYFAMELVRGLPITRYCDEHRLPAARRVALFVQVCRAVAHAHAKGIIHRDLKPSNILVVDESDLWSRGAPAAVGGQDAAGAPHPQKTDPQKTDARKSGEAPVPKVIDFGIAKATQGRLTDRTLFTAFHQFIGTPVYMSPEQAELGNAEVDARSDVYSLGVLLYELLAGEPPFDRQVLRQAGVDEIRRQIRDVEPPRPSARFQALPGEQRAAVASARGTAPAPLARELRGDLDWIAMRCLEKDRVRRYDTADALAADLERHLRHEPVAARAPGPLYVLLKLIRRQRVAFAAGSAVTFALMVGFVAATWNAAKIQEREQTGLRVAAQTRELAARRRAYAADMNLAQQALAVDNFARASELLDRQRPKAGETDLRGWEWRYLWQFCADESAWTLPGKSPFVERPSVSRDGAWLAINGPTPTLWNLRTRQPAAWPVPADAAVVAAAWSPTEPVLAILHLKPAERAGPGTKPIPHVLLWDAAQQRVALSVPLGAGYFQVRFTDDGLNLVLAQKTEVGLWRIATGEHVYAVAKPAGRLVAFSADGSAVAVERDDGAVEVIDVATGRRRWQANLARDDIDALAFSPDGKILASTRGGFDGTIHLWDAATGAVAGALTGHRGFIEHLVFSPDGNTLVTAGQDRTLRVWNLKARKLMRAFHGHIGTVTGVAFAGDAVNLVSTAADGTTRGWVLEKPPFGYAYQTLDTPVIRWAFTDSQAVIAVDRAGNVIRWRERYFKEPELVVRTSRPLSATNPPEPRIVCLPGNIPLVALATGRGVTQVWDWSVGKLVREIATPADRALPVAFLEGGRKLLLNYESNGNAGATPRGLHEWDLATGELRRSWSRTAPLGNYAVFPDERRAVVRAADPAGVSLRWNGPVVSEANRAETIIDLATGKTQPLANVAMGLRGMPISPDGRFYVAPDMSTSTPVYETKNFRRVATLTNSVVGMLGGAFSPDGRRLALTGAGLEAVRVWETETWEPVLTLEANGSGFFWTQFSPDGNILGSTTFDGRLHLWRAPSWAEIAAAEKAR